MSIQKSRFRQCFINFQNDFIIGKNFVKTAKIKRNAIKTYSYEFKKAAVIKLKRRTEI